MDNKLTVPYVRPYIEAYRSKPENKCGGSLHIVLDDGNIEDHYIFFCRNYAEDKGDDYGVMLCDMLLNLSKTQRRKVIW